MLVMIIGINEIIMKGWMNLNKTYKANCQSNHEKMKNEFGYRYCSECGEPFVK